ncbi:hypothetical protein DFH07DRAFT_765732 [Mycena maculata]|uniref:Ribonuclease H1 N-terminal domain-containing protein n=1 Tax=Mycena maculata TaxID=230809 RepID=A0AAD7K937_9AGAR|nr:hypothetical protein DFH07DRAFT_765732 [Mycena maculata]
MQGVPHARVYVVVGDSARKKKPKGPKKAVYVVFCGRQFGVFQTWPETVALVSGVPNCIFHSYSSLREAEAALCTPSSAAGLECQLNTLGVHNALHESVWGRNAAVRHRETSVVMPPFPQDFNEDVFQ